VYSPVQIGSRLTRPASYSVWHKGGRAGGELRERGTRTPVLLYERDWYPKEPPEELGPSVNGYLAETGRINQVKLVYKPSACPTADGYHEDPDLIPDDDDQLLSYYRNTLFVSTDAPKKQPCTRAPRIGRGLLLRPHLSRIGQKKPPQV